MRKLRITVSDAEDGTLLDMGVILVSPSCRSVEVKAVEDRDISEDWLELAIGSPERPSMPPTMSERVTNPKGSKKRG